MTENTTNEVLNLQEEGEDMKDTRVILDKLKEMDNRIEKMSDKMDARIEKMSDEMRAGFSRLDEKINHLEKKTEHLSEKIDRLDEDVHGIKLELENETRRNIQVIAEGHVDLARNLDRIMQNQYEDKQDRELIKVRSNYLDSEIKKIRDHVHMPA